MLKLFPRCARCGMVCPVCGCEQAGPAQFCRQCGQRVGQEAVGVPQEAYAQPGGVGAIPPYIAYAMQRARRRVHEHVQVLAILWFVFGGVRLLTGLIAAMSLHAIAMSGMFSFGDIPPFVPHLVRTLAPIIAVASAVRGLLALLVGYALQTRQSWGRVLAIVVGILELIKIPLGTALGIYTLWVMAPSASGDEWRQMQRVEA